MTQRISDSLNKSNKAVFSIAITCYFTFLDGKINLVLRGLIWKGRKDGMSAKYHWRLHWIYIFPMQK